MRPASSVHGVPQKAPAHRSGAGRFLGDPQIGEHGQPVHEQMGLVMAREHRIPPPGDFADAPVNGRIVVQKRRIGGIRVEEGEHLVAYVRLRRSQQPVNRLLRETPSCLLESPLQRVGDGIQVEDGQDPPVA